MTNAWQALAANFAVVALVTSIWSQLLGWLDRQSWIERQVVEGLLIGGGTVATMMMAVEVSTGSHFDLRSGVLCVGAFFGGPVVAVVAAAIAVIYRGFEGGAGATVGISNLLASALIGLLVRGLAHTSKPGYGWVLVLGSAMFALIWSSVALLPAAVAARAINDFALPTSIMSFVATVMMGLTILQARATAWEREILHLALIQAPDFQYIKDVSGAFVATTRPSRH